MSVDRDGRTSSQLKQLFLSTLLKTIHHCLPRWWTRMWNTLHSHESPHCKNPRGFRELNVYFADVCWGDATQRQRWFWPKSQQPTHSWSRTLSSSVISVQPGCVYHTFRLLPEVPFSSFLTPAHSIEHRIPGIKWMLSFLCINIPNLFQIKLFKS